ncbi:MAG: hypothetical protein NT150_10885 [Bacteroidetes bacterium]|nr:hypothetical protein [Bacteroidota bacterium]
MRKTAIALVCVIVLLSSCSKETIYNHYLKGNWTIYQLDIRETTDTISSSYSLFNAGIYTFHKNNEGSVTMSADTSKKTIDFKWSTVSNKQVLLSFESELLEKWDVLIDEPRDQTWECTSADTISAGGVVVISTLHRKMYLKKFD